MKNNKSTKWSYNKSIIVITIILLLVVSTIPFYIFPYCWKVNSLSTDGLACVIGGLATSIVTIGALIFNSKQTEKQIEENRMEADKKHKELINFQLKQERRTILYRLSKDMANYYSHITNFGILITQTYLSEKEFIEYTKQLFELSNLLIIHLDLFKGTKDNINITYELMDEFKRFSQIIQSKEFKINSGSEIYVKSIYDTYFNKVNLLQENLRNEFKKFSKEFIENEVQE